MEHEISHPIFHEHPLSRIPNLAAVTDYPWYNWCRGCSRYFRGGEAVYGCSRKCGFRCVLHEECMKMPREIRHPLHPSYTLTLTQHYIDDENLTLITLNTRLYIDDKNCRCAVCEDREYGQLCYKCTKGCEFMIEMRCAGGLADEDEKHPPLNHLSHPQHQLCFSKKTSQGWCFPCDACGTTEKGNSYICAICDYWIHETCALLPACAPFPSHHHSLCLSFYPPYEYIKYAFDCAICSAPLRLRHWVYHCHLCRYVVHLNCAPSTKKECNNENAVNDGKCITKSPIDDMYEEIIRAFVERESGKIVILDDNSSTGKYKFNNHNHLLSFTTFPDSSSSHDDDDDDDDSIPRIPELRCDGCTLPIDEKNEYEKGYMSCDECKYFLHLSCFNLPPQIPYLPHHPLQGHNLMLQNAGKLTCWAFCNICFTYTNGLFYTCTECNFKVDIKCASLPDTIKHAAHPRHNHLKLIRDTNMFSFCSHCYYTIDIGNGFYRCDGCRFSVCVYCVLLPSQNKHRLEKHKLALTYDTYANRPGEFYCSSCEAQMNPKERMYHCRDCDQSFHTKCFPATSGKYRNINFGSRQFVTPTAIHDPHHPLRFQIITKKKRCNLCHQDRYDEPGFQCVSCNFVMCLESCGRERISATKAI